MKILYLKKIYDALKNEGVIYLSNEAWTSIKDDLFQLVGDIPLIAGISEKNPDIVRVELLEDFSLES